MTFVAVFYAAHMLLPAHHVGELAAYRSPRSSAPASVNVSDTRAPYHGASAIRSTRTPSRLQLKSASVNTSGLAPVRAQAAGEKNEFVVVTGGTLKETCGLVWFLHSMQRYAPRTRVVVFDLGPPHFNQSVLRRAHRGTVEFRRLEAEQQLPWFHGGQRQNWRSSPWKPVAVKEVAVDYGTAVWIDAGSGLGAAFNTSFMQHLLKTNGVFSIIARGSTLSEVHPDTFALFGRHKCCAGLAAHSPRRGAASCCCCPTTDQLRDGRGTGACTNCTRPRGTINSYLPCVASFFPCMFMHVSVHVYARSCMFVHGHAPGWESGGAPVCLAVGMCRVCPHAGKRRAARAACHLNSFGFGDVLFAVIVTDGPFSRAECVWCGVVCAARCTCYSGSLAASDTWLDVGTNEGDLERFGAAPSMCSTSFVSALNACPPARVPLLAPLLIF